MKSIISFFLLCLICLCSAAQHRSAALALPDSVKATAFYAEVTTTDAPKGKALIRTGAISLVMEKDKKESSFGFEFPKGSQVVAMGGDVEAEKDELEWTYAWQAKAVYKLMIASASDSAGNFTLYSAYVGLPGTEQWKFIGTCRVIGSWEQLRSFSWSFSPSQRGIIETPNVFWVQRSGGSWKPLEGIGTPPQIRWTSHLDSATREAEENRRIREAMAEGKTGALLSHEGIYYRVLKEGSGRQVQVSDTVTVHYRGYLFETGEVFDQTGETPARFPLNRLIRGWQLGLPLVKVGGKILLVIPSHLAYSIRTRAAKIPPNSILAFEVEVLEAK